MIYILQTEWCRLNSDLWIYNRADQAEEEEEEEEEGQRHLSLLIPTWNETVLNGS